MQPHKPSQYQCSMRVRVGLGSPSLKTQWPGLDLLPASVNTAGSGTTCFKVRNDLCFREAGRARLSWMERCFPGSQFSELIICFYIWIYLDERKERKIKGEKIEVGIIQMKRWCNLCTKMFTVLPCKRAHSWTIFNWIVGKMIYPG